jgi:protein tyrosine phosphatase (PTP) superfamily phosphohydrolase (DUF442 family)
MINQYTSKTFYGTLKVFQIFCAIALMTSVSYGQTSPLAIENVQEPFGNLEKTPQFGHVVYAFQPDKETVAMMKDQGINLVLNIRGENEDPGFDERKLVEENGMSYIQIPYMKGREIDGDSIDKIKEVIDATAANGTKMMLHCGHSQRAGSALGVILYRDYGYSREAANEMAKAAGMTSEFITKVHNEYLDTLIQN